MADVIIGTAGHVDHGKTELVKALTGQDTDRLPEEKRRGISIDLGFAEFVLPSGRRAGLVDVPGHERFVRNMVAGATGMDLVLLVVAADEGVMPQTREHLDILQLLGAQAGVVVLTKMDLVDEEWADLVEEEVREAVRGTFLEGAPVVRVSSRTGRGLEELRAAVDALIARVRPRPVDAPARLPIDRCFTVAGFGTVVTGTLHAGRIRVEDRLELLPAGVEVRVRQLQVHGRRVEEARAGQRVAVNLAGTGGVTIARGHVLAAPGTLEPAVELALQLRVLPSAPGPLSSGARLRLHAGTDEVLGRVTLLEGDALAPGEEGFARFRAERPLVVARGDRYIVRSYSPVRTVGGGTVLDVGRRYRRGRPAELARLEAFASGDPLRAAEAELEAAGGLLAEAELGRRLLRTPESLAELRERLLAAGRAEAVPGGYLALPGTGAGLLAQTRALLAAYHGREPLRPGMPREELRLALVPTPEPRAFAALLEAWAGQGQVALEGDAVRLPDFRPGAAGAEAEQAARVAVCYREAGLAAPAPAEAAARLGLDADRVLALLEHLVARGELVRLAPEHYVHREAYEAAVRVVARHLLAAGPATVAELRDLLGTTRKYVLPLLEAMDRQGLTQRSGDRRVLTLRGERLAREPA